MTVFLNPDRVLDRHDELLWAVRWLLDHLESDGHLARLPHVRGVSRLGQQVILRCDAARNREVVASVRELLLRLDWIHEEEDQVFVTRLGLHSVPAWRFYAWMPAPR